ncbi:MAG: glycosyltransferase family 4 protein [Clostridia bacterium]|nr:glycosyltransferase family 4 protein [Clostridia bacterium]
MKKILIFANLDMGLYNFRKELLETFLKKGYEVYISLPMGPRVKDMEAMGCKFIETPVDRRGMNPIADLKLFFKYRKILKQVKPDVVLTYTIKPNIYGGLACRMAKVPYLSNITGLGSAVHNGGVVAKILMMLYRRSAKFASCLFFQNSQNLEFFKEKKAIAKNYVLLPGSGVNIKEYTYEKYPSEETNLSFLFIGRLMRDKGVGELVEAARNIRKDYPEITFDLVGFCEEEYKETFDTLNEGNVVNALGQQQNVREFIKSHSATVLPSYHEGTANVLLESASSGRPCIASNIPGCKEIIDDAVTGYVFEARSAAAVEEALRKFILLSHDERKQMGVLGRLKMEREYDRQIIIDHYLREIGKVE